MRHFSSRRLVVVVAVEEKLTNLRRESTLERRTEKKESP